MLGCSASETAEFARTQFKTLLAAGEIQENTDKKKLCAWRHRNNKIMCLAAPK
jgi:hypothetical protein